MRRLISITIIVLAIGELHGAWPQASTGQATSPTNRRLETKSAGAVLATTGTEHITVRDGDTHYAVPANIELQGPQSLSARTDDTGSVTIQLSPGTYRIQVSAPGYQTTRSRIAVKAGRSWSDGFMLRPVNPPEEQESLRSELRSGNTLIHGYAVDDRGQSIGGVRVRLQNAGVEATTNERGYYSLSVATPPETSPGVPGTDTLIAEKNGYKTIVHRNLIVAGEDGGGVYLDLEKGTGVSEFDDTHKLMKKGKGCPRKAYS